MYAQLTMVASREVCCQNPRVSTLVRNLLLLQVPLAGDPEAAAAWDRCVLSWQAGSAPAAAAFSLFTPPWALP
jgi:hypothetical protein